MAPRLLSKYPMPGGGGDNSILSSAMREELSKGDDSDVPKDTLAGVSMLKDYLSGDDPSREAYGDAISGDLDSIKARKLDLYSKLQNGDSLSSSQTVGLGILALGLLAAGAAAKGKAGIGMAGNAFNQGGQIYLAQNKADADNNNREALSQIKDLTAQERDLTKQGVENKLAPLKQEETIGAKVEARRRMVDQGLVNPNGNSVNIVMPKHVDSQTAKTIDTAGAAIDDLTRTADQLQQFDADGWAKWQAKSQMSSTPEGKLALQVQSAALQAARTDSGGRPSQYLEQVEKKIIAGDWTARPQDVAALLRWRAGRLAASTARIMEDSEANRNGYGDQIKKMRGLASAAGVSLGDPTLFANQSAPGSNSGLDFSKAPPNMSPDQFSAWKRKQTPAASADSSDEGD